MKNYIFVKNNGLVGGGGRSVIQRSWPEGVNSKMKWRMFARSVKAKRCKARATCVNGRLLCRGSVQQNMMNLPCASWSCATVRWLI
jgi:hypothetical protein